MNLAELEAEAFLTGQWRNFDELEMNLCLAELEAVVDASRRKQHNQNKFLAALKGINLDEDAAESKEKFDKVVARAQAKARGETDEPYEFSDTGLGVEYYEDED